MRATAQIRRITSNPCSGENSQKVHKKLLDFFVEIWYNIYVPKENKKGELK